MAREICVKCHELRLVSELDDDGVCKQCRQIGPVLADGFTV